MDQGSPGSLDPRRQSRSKETQHTKSAPQTSVQQVPREQQHLFLFLFPLPLCRGSRGPLCPLGPVLLITTLPPQPTTEKCMGVGSKSISGTWAVRGNHRLLEFCWNVQEAGFIRLKAPSSRKEARSVGSLMTSRTLSRAQGQVRVGLCCSQASSCI